MRCEKNMRARRTNRGMFYFHFSREGRANAQLKRSAKRTAFHRGGEGVFLFTHATLPSMHSTCSETVPFLNQTRERWRVASGVRRKKRRDPNCVKYGRICPRDKIATAVLSKRWKCNRPCFRLGVTRINAVLSLLILKLT